MLDTIMRAALGAASVVVTGIMLYGTLYGDVAGGTLAVTVAIAAFIIRDAVRG